MKDPLCVQQGQKSRFGSESSSTSYYVYMSSKGSSVRMVCAFARSM